MTIKASGSLALSEIETEFGGAAPTSLSEYYKGGSYTTSLPTTKNGNIPSSGSISINQFYNTVKYTAGSASWGSTTGQFYWQAPAWVDTIYISGTGGGGGGGQCEDTSAIHDYGAAGGGSSGKMVSGLAYSVTPGTTYGLYVGGGGGDHQNGVNTIFNDLVLNGGSRGDGGGVYSYQMNGVWYSGGTLAGVTSPYWYYPGGGAYWSPGDNYGNYLRGGNGGNGWGNTGGGAGGSVYVRSGWGGASGGGYGSGGSTYGAGGGGAVAGNLNGGQYAGGGSGVRGFLSITW